MNEKEHSVYPTLRKKGTKQCPWDAIAANSTLFRGVFFSLITMFVPLCQWGAKTVPLGEPNYGQPNSTPTEGGIP